MAAALGLKCTSLCWVPVQSAVLDPPRSSSSPIQSAGTISVWRISSHGSFSLSPFAVKKLENHGSRKLTGSVKVASNEGGIVEMEEFGDPVSLGTMKLPTNVDLKKLEALLFQGRLSYVDGSFYDGLWKHGKRSGTGAFYFSSGDVFQGSWRDDLMHGKGWFYFHNGDRWFADFWKGKANGEGRYYSKHGEVFFGHFKDNWRHGKSLYIESNGASIHPFACVFNHFQGFAMHRHVV